MMLPGARQAISEKVGLPLIFKGLPYDKKIAASFRVGQLHGAAALGLRSQDPSRSADTSMPVTSATNLRVP